LPSLGVAIANAALYVGALLSPVDLVLANELLNTPLPSEIVLSRTVTVVLALVALVVGVGVSVALWWTTPLWQNVDWPAVVFLMSGMFLPLLPVLAFASHPSETYLYVPAAFYGLLLSYGLATAFGVVKAATWSRAYVATVMLLFILFAGATWVRNDRVIECARTARQILNGLPAELSQGAWTVALANVPGEPSSRRYGFYGFRGVDTIGHREMANRAVTSAVQLVSKNGSVRGEIVGASELINRCEGNSLSRRVCLWVHWDGRVERAD
jgi:hypothetical protein